MSTFQDLGLGPDVLKSLGQMGFEQPMPIQEKVIPLVLEGKDDIVGLAQTGTGKTAAFGLPIVQQISSKDKHIKALILCPTRELAIQISKDLTAFAASSTHVKNLAVYGGASIEGQLRALKKHPQILVATPGRMLDLIKRGKADVTRVETLVLDEADEMLNIGFREELEAVLEQTPSEKRTLLFSATFGKEISRIAKTYMSSPIEISVGKRNAGSDNVSYLYYVTHSKHKYLVLKRIADLNPNIYGIVFCRTRKETKDIAEKLIKDNYNADALHGDLSQAQREHVMKRFRVKNLQILVATDVAARGLDVTDLSHVINYNLPDEPEVYTHRSGRTGRAGKKGTCIALIGSRERKRLQRIEQAVGKSFEQKQIPSGVEICEKQLFNFINRINKAEVNEKQIEAYLPQVTKQLEWLDREQLIKHIVSLEFNRFLDYYKNAPDLNLGADKGERGEKEKKSKKKRRENITFTSLFLNAGSQENFSPRKLMSLVNRFCHAADIPFGEIDVKRKTTFFEVENKFSKDVISNLNGQKVGGVVLKVSREQAAASAKSQGKKKKNQKKK